VEDDEQHGQGGALATSRVSAGRGVIATASHGSSLRRRRPLLGVVGREVPDA
jgi:hypothetical protein